MSSVIYSGQTIFQPNRWSLFKGDAAIEPVTLEQMKAHSRIEHFDDDDDVNKNIKVAREWVENFTHRALITQAFIYKIDRFPGSTTTVLQLSGGNTQSLTSIEYLDTDGALQTWASSNYIADLVSQPALVGLAFNKDWPSIREWDLPVTITYVAGYGNASADVPYGLQKAIMMIASELYENREESVAGATVVNVSWNAQRLAEAYRIHRII